MNLAFWQEYIASEGAARCLETLEQFTNCIDAGEGAAAAELLRSGLERFRQDRVPQGKNIPGAMQS